MSEFVNVCAKQDLVINSGVAALVNGEQIALFYINDTVYALNNFDPIGKAYVMSRGMIGDLKGNLMVASPLQKQHYNLETGVCMDLEGVSIPVYPAKIDGDQVLVQVG